MAHQGESGGNMARPSNPSGHFTPPSFPSPATIAAQASHQALFQENQYDPSIGVRTPQLVHPIADTLVPLAVAPQAFHFQPEISQPRHRGTMPQAGGVPNAMPLQHFSGTTAVPPPLHGKELAARVAAAPPLGTNSYGARSQAGPMLPPSGWPGSLAPPVQQPAGGGGQTSWGWAPPAQQRPSMPAASPASGSASAQAQPPRVTTTGKKIFEEFLLEAGVLDQSAVDKIILDDLVEEMLGDDDDGEPELGPVERDGRMVSLGDVLLALGLGAGSSSSSGPSTHQARMPAQEALGAGAGATGGCDQAAAAAAAEAREWRSRRMAKRKEAAARYHRPEKHAAPRRNQN